MLYEEIIEVEERVVPYSKDEAQNSNVECKKIKELDNGQKVLLIIKLSEMIIRKFKIKI